LYRLTEPTKVFYREIEASRLSIGWISGPVPSGLVPTLGTIGRYETDPGKFDESAGLIYLYMHGVIDQSGHLVIKVTTHDPKGEWLRAEIEGECEKCEVEGTTSIFLIPPTLGTWRIDVQTTIGTATRTVVNASFTVGKYIFDISADGLPNDVRAAVHLDGVAIGEINGKVSIGLGWLPEHIITMQDVALDQTASRYHVLQPEMKISGPGQYHFEYRLQHYLKVESPYPSNASGWCDHGKTMLVTAPVPTQQASKDTRIVFRGWSGDYLTTDQQISIVMDGPKRIYAQYVTQYLLTVVSPVGNPQGSGWYDEGSSATFSVASPAAEGIMGMLGGKHVFDRWSGDSNAATTIASVTMTGPKVVTAEWRTDYTIPYIILGALIVVVLVAGVTVAMKRKKSRP
jgi:hypothetical protein